MALRQPGVDFLEDERMTFEIWVGDCRQRIAAARKRLDKAEELLDIAADRQAGNAASGYPSLPVKPAMSQAEYALLQGETAAAEAEASSGGPDE